MPDYFPLGSQIFDQLGRLKDTYGPFQINDLDESGSSAEGERGIYVGLSVSAQRLRAVFAILYLILAVLVSRAAYLQILQGDRYAAAAEGNRVRIVPSPTERGVVYDRTGIPLVRNIPNFRASITPVDLPTEPQMRQETMRRIAEAIDLAPADVEDAVAAHDPDRSLTVVIADGLTYELAVRTEIESARTPALSLVNSMRREYLGTDETPSLSHLLGYVAKASPDDIAAHPGYLNDDVIGKAGLEKAYEGELRGRYGSRRLEVDATGRLKKEVASDAGEQGRNLVLTVDYALQRDATELLADGLKAAGSSRGAVIVMDPRTGAILALVSLPAYDANQFAAGISAEDYQKLVENKDRPLFPRATSGLLPSGSTFKPVVAAAALAEGFIDASTTIFSSGGLRVGQWFFPDWKAGGHGATNVRKALAESVNSFFYVIGGGHEAYPNVKPLGADLIADYARRFGFGTKTGIDLPSEAEGFLPTPAWKEEVRGESWYVGDTYHVAIGQGDVMVTPLQIARMTAAFANGGKLVKPHLVAQVGGVDVRDGASAVPVVAADAIEVVREGMRETVLSGSARSFASLPWAVAAKTGTAQWNSRKPTHAWFTSFAPYDNPEIVVTVVIEEGGEGSTAAAPVARAIYQRYFTGALPSFRIVAPAAADATPTSVQAEPTEGGESATMPADADSVGQAAP
jgi:penicillin-binding protein 2